MINRFKLNGGFPRVAQLMLPMIFLPFLCLLCLLMVKKPNLSSFVFSVPIILFMIFIIKRIYSYADLYIENDELIISKLFFSKRIKLIECTDITDTLLPFTFCLKFKSNRKVFFFSKSSEIIRQLKYSDQTSYLNFLKRRLGLVEQ